MHPDAKTLTFLLLLLSLFFSLVWCCTAIRPSLSTFLSLRPFQITDSLFGSQPAPKTPLTHTQHTPKPNLKSPPRRPGQRQDAPRVREPEGGEEERPHELLLHGLGGEEEPEAQGAQRGQRQEEDRGGLCLWRWW